MTADPQDTEELKPCPFCKSRKVKLAHVAFGDNDVCRAVCGKCRAEGPNGTGQANATKLWNTRPDSPVTVMREALEKCRDKFANYAELHRAKFNHAESPCEYEDIQHKIDRNLEMVAVCDEALARISR